MDTEEHIEIQHNMREGLPQTDEGPYYHEPWWEAYKGSVKGKLGGARVGGELGAAAGLVAAGVLFATLTVPFSLATGALIVAGFAAAGMAYGAHEFGDIGKAVGSNAAVAEIQEKRMEGKFAEIKQEISDLKNAILGRPVAEPEVKANAEQSSAEAIDYRTKHCDGEHCGPENSQWIFWKVAAVGLAAGLAAGALFAVSGLTGHVLELLGPTVEHMFAGSEATLSMTTLGLFGASFGVNRDLFRQAFDQTDLWFKGIFDGGGGSHEKAQAPAASKPEPTRMPKTEESPFITVVYSGHNDDVPHTTHHRDKLNIGRMALLNMDPSKTIRQ